MNPLFAKPRAEYSSFTRLALILLCVMVVWIGTPCRVSAFDSVDRFTDIIWHHQANGDNIVWNLERSIFRQTETLPKAESTAWQIVATGDFNRDGRTDLLFRNTSSGENAVWLMSGASRLGAYPIGSGDSSWYVVGTGDFNRDGNIDILWRHRSQDQTRVWTMGGANGVALLSNIQIRTPQPDTNWVASVTGDFNNDGNTDIVWRHRETGYLWFWLMDGVAMTNSAKINKTPGPDYKLAASGQFTSIGKTALVWRHTGKPAAATLIWHLNGVEFLKSEELVDAANYKPVLVEDQAWTIAGTGNFRTERLISASAVDSTNMLLSWHYGEGRPVTIQRRKLGETNWTVVARDYKPMQFQDTNFPAGGRVEYQICEVTNRTLKDYICVGNRVAPPEKRGRVLVLVDKTLAKDSNLRRSLDDFEKDLTGDGYRVVVDINAERHDDKPSKAEDSSWGENKARIEANKKIIKAFYAQAPSENNYVVLVGHVAIPYAGTVASDGHITGAFVHQGAWTADAYYADTVDDQLWTDVQRKATINPSYPEASNGAGDGKFDQDSLPTLPEVALGRIDFANLPALKGFGQSLRQSEIRLLVQYFQKNHRYRHGLAPFPLPETMIVGSAFPEYAFSDGWTIFDVALRMGSRNFGNSLESIVERDLFNSGSERYLLGLFSGPGQCDHITHGFEKSRLLDRSAKDMGDNNNESRVGFYLVHGSWFADFNLTDNNFYRSLLATPNYGLAAIASSSKRGPAWFLETLALGETLGNAMLHSIRTLFQAGYDVDRWVSLMGDPTLRLQTTQPPLDARWDGKERILSWKSSPEEKGPESGIQYLVERSTEGLSGPWLKVGEFQGTSAPDPSAPAQRKMYRIRAQKLVTTGSGSFFNLSQAVFCDAN